MGVIHDDEERLPRPHLLEPAGDRLHAAERASDGVGRQPQCPPDADGGQEVHHIVLADQRRGEREPARRRVDGQAHAVEGRGPLGRPHAGAATEAIGQGVEAEPGDHACAGRIVAVHDGDAARLGRGGQQLEEPALGAAVLVEGAVEVEVILREVGEDADVERERVDARERQRVRADLHRHPANAARTHGGQHRLDLERLRRRLAGGPDLVADDVLDRAENPGGASADAQQRVDQVRGRRLAVRARDADQRQGAGGMVPVGAGQRGERAARRWDDDLGHGNVGDRLALGHHQRSTAPDGVGHEAPRVLLEAGHGHEDVAAGDPPRVGGQPRDRPRRRADHPLVGQCVQQHAHGHLARHINARHRHAGGPAAA